MCMCKIGNSKGVKQGKELSNQIASTGHYQMISKILKGVNKIVHAMLVENKSVVIHCSDGWDRTA